MTLPEDVIEALRSRDRDLAHAVVSVVGDATASGHRRPAARREVAELVQIAPRSFLITVDRKVVKQLPGCELVSIGSDAALLALNPGQGLADVALAVLDRLEEPGIDPREKEALAGFRTALRAWMRDKKLACETRSIVVIRRASATLALSWNWPEPIGSLWSWVKWWGMDFFHRLPELAHAAHAPGVSPPL